MGFNPTFLILSFAAALYLVNTLNAGPILAAFVAVIFPFLANCLVLYILKFNIWLDILSISNVVILVLQFVVAYVVFIKIRDTDSIAEMFYWSTGGLLILFFLPLFVQFVR
jgi:hypothetical protein